MDIVAFKVPAYPDELTDKWWQKQKGLIAKIKTKDDGTGIGKELTALHNAYRQINWDGLNYDSRWPGVFGSRTENDIQAGIGTSREVAKKSDAVSKRAREVEIKAKTLADTWSKDKLIPKSSVAAAQKVSAKAKELSFALALGTIADIAKKGAEENRAGTAKNRAEMLKLIRSVPDKLDALAVDADKGQTLAEWPGFWKQNVRFIGTQMPQVLKAYPNAAAEITAIRVHSNQQRTPKSQNELDARLADLATHARALRRLMG